MRQKRKCWALKNSEACGGTWKFPERNDNSLYWSLADAGTLPVRPLSRACTRKRTISAGAARVFVPSNSTVYTNAAVSIRSLCARQWRNLRAFAGSVSFFLYLHVSCNGDITVNTFDMTNHLEDGLLRRSVP